MILQDANGLLWKLQLYLGLGPTRWNQAGSLPVVGFVPVNRGLALAVTELKTGIIPKIGKNGHF